ncbi:hypothetical protein B0H16DRAFT_1569063 [Mycena metata]|uniref:Secreted protein n=1 Tax=Mycena metata TaxID=1033252 RepID=A0AAD7IB59_9AGAR|nr:hypothetical protein B0H16DRAFT_1569063 [Mycena metata]
MSPPYLFVLCSALVQVLNFLAVNVLFSTHRQPPPFSSCVTAHTTQMVLSKRPVDVPNVVTAFNAAGPQASSTPQTLSTSRKPSSPFNAAGLLNAASSHLNAMPQALASIPRAISSSSAVPPPFPHVA